MKSSNVRKTIWFIVRLGVGLLLLYVVLVGIDWAALAGALLDVGPLWLAAAVLSMAAAIGLKVLRWSLLLENYAIRLPFAALARAYVYGQTANIVLPFRGGEIVRAGALVRSADKTAANVVGSIVMEKYIDLIFLIAFSLLTLPNLPADIRRSSLPYIVVGGAALTGGLVFLLFFADKLGPALARVKTPFDLTGRLAAMLATVAGENRWIKSPRAAAPPMLLSLVIWLVMASTNLLLLRAFGLPPGIGAALLVMVLVHFGLLPGLMPGNIGPFYFFASAALAVYHVGAETRLAFAMTLHAIVSAVPIVAAGVFLLLPVGRKKAGES